MNLFRNRDDRIRREHRQEIVDSLYRTADVFDGTQSAGLALLASTYRQAALVLERMEDQLPIHPAHRKPSKR